MDEFTSSHGDISRKVASGERWVQSWKAMVPILHHSESFGLARSFAGCTAPLAALTSPPTSLGTDYIDRFMEPVLLHDPAGTSKTYFWPIHARKIYARETNNVEVCFILFSILISSCYLLTDE